MQKALVLNAHRATTAWLGQLNALHVNLAITPVWKAQPAVLHAAQALLPLPMRLNVSHVSLEPTHQFLELLSAWMYQLAITPIEREEPPVSKLVLLEPLVRVVHLNVRNAVQAPSVALQQKYVVHVQQSLVC